MHRRYPPFSPIMYRGKLSEYEYVSDEEMYSGDLVEVDATGTACLLMKTEIFKDIDPPWFELGVGKDGKTVGEDINFCHKMRGKGYHIYVDTDAPVDHLSLFRVDKSTYELFKKFHKKETNHECWKQNRKGCKSNPCRQFDCRYGNLEP